MESDNESFNLEDLPMFVNSVLEKAELICREENVDSSAVETRQCKNYKRKTTDCGLRTADCGLRTADCGQHTRGTMKTIECSPTADQGENERKDSQKYVCVRRSS